MQPFQQRVVDEKSELDIKVAKLKTFMEHETFGNLSTDEQVRMHRQVAAMTEYSTVLGERIAAFK